MKTYTTVQGDLWDIISYRCYGDEGKIGELIAANPAYAGTVVFAANAVLNVPETAVKSPATNLPPWRTEV